MSVRLPADVDTYVPSKKKNIALRLFYVLSFEKAGWSMFLQKNVVMLYRSLGGICASRFW